jgi:hypothetical protein
MCGNRRGENTYQDMDNPPFVVFLFGASKYGLSHAILPLCSTKNRCFYGRLVLDSSTLKHGDQMMLPLMFYQQIFGKQGKNGHSYIYQGEGCCGCVETEEEKIHTRTWITHHLLYFSDGAMQSSLSALQKIVVFMGDWFWIQAH